MVAVDEHPRTGRIEGGYDAVVIGSEPEGLVCAAYLGRAGLRTILLEESNDIGGRCAARSFGDGFSVAGGEYLLHHFDRQVVRDLDLYKFGLDFSNRRVSDTLYVGGAPLTLDPDPWKCANIIAETWPEDAAAYEDYCKVFGALGETLAATAGREFQQGESRDLAERVGRVLKNLNDEQKALLSQLTFSSVSDILDEHFEHEPLKGVLAYDALRGLATGPMESGGGLGLLRRFMGEIAGARGVIAHPKGGISSLTDALRRVAAAANVEIRTESPVSDIIVEWDEAAGVQLAAGGQIRANVVISSLDARRTFGDYFGPLQMDIDFQRGIERTEPKFGFARFDATLDAAPSMIGFDESPHGRIILASTIDGLEDAYRSARKGEFPTRPTMEIMLPGSFDETFRAGDTQLISGLIYPAPLPDEDQGRAERLRARLLESVLTSIESVAPDIRTKIKEAAVRFAPEMGGASGSVSAIWRAQPPLAMQWTMLGKLGDGAGVDGFYFCGPEAALGMQTACAAARRSAHNAIKHARKRAVR